MTNTALTVTEQQELNQYEGIIERGLETFVDVGNALLAIRDKKLYRQHGTFEKYCQKRWKFGDRHARHLMSAAETIANIKTGSMVPVLPRSERQIRPLTSLEPNQQREAWQKAIETAPDGRVTGAHVKKIVDEIKRPNNVHFSSESPEWYTPSHIVERVIKVMGVIDLDPCSNDKDNPSVPAVQHYTQEDNGLLQDWFGRVYMNPPYGSGISDWVEYLCREWEKGNVTEAVALVPARTDTEWFRRLRQFPRCFIWGRLRFSGYGNSAPFPSMVVYLGTKLNRFAEVFGDIGDVYTWLSHTT